MRWNTRNAHACIQTHAQQELEDQLGVHIKFCSFGPKTNQDSNLTWKQNFKLFYVKIVCDKSIFLRLKNNVTCFPKICWMIIYSLFQSDNSVGLCAWLTLYGLSVRQR